MGYGPVHKYRRTCHQKVLDLAGVLELVLAFGQDRYVHEVVWVDEAQAAIAVRCVHKVHWCIQHLLLQKYDGEKDGQKVQAEVIGTVVVVAAAAVAVGVEDCWAKDLVDAVDAVAAVLVVVA
jgi:hypothetical protein